MRVYTQQFIAIGVLLVLVLTKPGHLILGMLVGNAIAALVLFLLPMLCIVGVLSAFKRVGTTTRDILDIM